jgi:hypothetical protein
MNNNAAKFAISNNFATGILPEFIFSTLTEEKGPLLSPIRPFAYIMSYSGGAYKATSGSFSFFNQNVEKNIGALNFHSTLTNLRNVHVIMTGNFTPAQRKIVKNHCQIDVQNFNSLSIA